MARSFLKMVSNSIKHWYLPLIIGVIFIAVGFYVFANPAESYVALAIVFSLAFLINGIMDIIFSIVNREELEGWGWQLVMGILTMFVGILLLKHPEVSMITLPLFVGFVLLFRSIMAIGISLELKNYLVMDWGYFMGIGILGVIFSMILLFNPGFAGLSVVFWTGFLFIIIGGINIYWSLKLKKLHDVPKNISNELKDRYNTIKEKIQHEILDASNKS